MGSSYLALGYECNHNCICCPLTTYDRLHKRLSYEEIQKRLDKLSYADSQKHLVISGGEPMLHPQFQRIIEFAGEKGFHITVLSNVSLCKDRGFVKELKSHIPDGCFDIVTAIHSSVPQIHDSITGIPGSLLDTLEGLDNLVSAKIPVTIKHIFSRKSLGTLIETIQYLEQHFPPQVAFQFSTMDYSGRAMKHIEELFVTIEDIRLQLEKALDYLEGRMSVKRRISIIESPLCMIDPYYWKYYYLSGVPLDGYIAPNTDEVDVCMQVESECGSYFPPCSVCTVKNICSGTWKSAYQYGGDRLLNPIHANIF